MMFYSKQLHRNYLGASTYVNEQLCNIPFLLNDAKDRSVTPLASTIYLDF